MQLHCIACCTIGTANSLEAARVGVHNLPHCVMAVGRMDSQPIALAAHVGQAAGEHTALATRLCSHVATHVS